MSITAEGGGSRTRDRGRARSGSGDRTAPDAPIDILIILATQVSALAAQDRKDSTVGALRAQAGDVDTSTKSRAEWRKLYEARETATHAVG